MSYTMLSGQGRKGFGRFVIGLVSVTVFALSGTLVSGCGEKFGKDVLATVGQDQVTVEEYMTAVGKKPPEDEGDRMEVLTKIVDNRLVFQEAHRKGFMEDPGVISDYKQMLTNRLPGLLREHVKQDVVVTDEDLEPHKEMATVPTLTANMLIAKTLDKAEKALADIKGGKGFEEVYKARSEDFASIPTKGAQIRLDDPLYPVGVRAALNRLKPGELSPIMKLDIGYGIFRIEGRDDPEKRWEAKKASVVERIKEAKTKAVMDELLNKLRAKADIKVTKTPGGYKINIDGVTISHEGYLSTEASVNPHSPHSGLSEDTIKRAIKGVVDDYLLATEAVRLGLDRAPEFVTAKKLETEKIVTEKYIDKINEGITVTPEEVREYYEKNKGKFATSEKIRVSRILLDSMGAAEDVEQRLKAGEDFAALALKYSKDRESAMKGGNVGWVIVSKLRGALKDALVGLEPGEVAAPVKTDYGYEVLTVTEMKPSVIPELSDVEDTVRKRIALTKRSENVEALYDKLWKNAKVKINLKLLRSI